jgi:hypothetical protein
MNRRDIIKSSYSGAGSSIQHRPSEENYYNYNQSQQDYPHKRQNWTKAEQPSRNDKFHHEEENIDVQKDKLPYNKYNVKYEN